LSGPAGGLIGYASIIGNINERFKLKKKIVSSIGLDMGGTSTDESRFDG
jgi:N-methylhydantoinase A/oxoprolinase/acetone carboxylase beta subunit